MTSAQIPTDVFDEEARMLLEAPPLSPGHAESLVTPSIRIPYRTRVLRAEATREFDYVVPLPRFVRDGIHKVVITARVPACGGIVTRYVEFALAPKQLFHLDSSRFQLVRKPGPGEPVMLRFTPRDAAGNLLGMGLRNAMRVVPPEGAHVVRTIDHFDGSYTVELASPEGIRGALRIEIDGEVAVVRIPARTRAFSRAVKATRG